MLHYERATGAHMTQNSTEQAPEKTRENAPWIPLLDYAVLKGVSTSTLRRYIKAKKIEYKIENGRYLLRGESEASAALRTWDGVDPSRALGATHATSAIKSALMRDPAVEERIRNLEQKLMQAQEQIGELKMLVAIYEEKLAHLDV